MNTKEFAAWDDQEVFNTIEIPNISMKGDND